MKPNPFVSLFQSRKSIVGVGALVLVGLVYFLAPGGWPEKSTAMATIAGIAVSIITAIGKEDAAKSTTLTANVTTTTTVAPEDIQ